MGLTDSKAVLRRDMSCFTHSYAHSDKENCAYFEAIKQDTLGPDLPKQVKKNVKKKNNKKTQ